MNSSISPDEVEANYRAVQAMVGDALLADEKKFYSRFWALHRNPDLVAIFKLFGWRVFRRSSVLEGFEAFIGAHGFTGNRCVEIGTCKGLTAIVLARHFDEVVTIDVVDDPERRSIAASVGATNIRFVTVDGNLGKAAAIDGLTFDAAYVDGDHARDTASDFRLVQRCGQTLFHEYWPAQPAVVSLVDRLRDEGSVVTDGKLALWRAA